MSSGNTASNQVLQKACYLDSGGQIGATQQSSCGREQGSSSHHCASVGIVAKFNTSDKHLCSSVTRELEEMHCAAQWRGHAGCVWAGEALLGSVWGGLNSVSCAAVEGGSLERGQWEASEWARTESKAWSKLGGQHFHWKKGWEHRYCLLLFDFLLFSGLWTNRTTSKNPADWHLWAFRLIILVRKSNLQVR